MTFTDVLRKSFSGVIQKITNLLIRFGFTANKVTIFGLVGNIAASVLIAQGFLISGGVLAGLSCLLDALDGTIAKSGSGNTLYGSFLDSTLDRFSEFVIFLGLVLFFQKSNNFTGVIITFLAFGCSLLVSYIRAKAEGVGVNLKRGLLTRVERITILIISLLIRMPLHGMIIIAVLSFFTIIQRFWIARKKILEKDKGSK